MNLLEIRTWLAQESGRYDLVVNTTAYADNGANKYINAAIRMLDRMQTTKFTEAHLWKQALVNTRHVTFNTEFRSIHAAFATKESDSSRAEMEKMSLKEIKEQHFGYLGGTVDVGSPLYYTPAVFRLAPEAEMAIGDIDVPASYLDYIGESPYKYNGILFSPPCDESYSIEVWGYVYSKTLALDADENWWTWNHPELVIMASQLVLEKMMRNTEGVKDWTAAIKMELQGIDFDLVEEDFANIDQLGG